ncbi:MAG: DUF4129 domain-containing protein [Planctomycetales bacterium]|nr:DUF4129 domain-containing protein [Planctomycetales bacterium]
MTAVRTVFSCNDASRAAAPRKSHPGPGLPAGLGALLLAILLLAILLPAPLTLAFSAADIDVQRALQSLPDNHWYNKESRSYNPPSVSPQHDNPLRREGWLAPPERQSPAATSNGNNWNLPGWFAEWFSTVFISLLGVVLLVVVALLAYHSLRSYMPARFERRRSPPAVTIDPARVAALPFEVRSTADHPLREAERLMQAGKFNEATLFLYGYLLLALDQARKIHLQQGRTNRMYLRELRESPRLSELVEQAMLAFEDVFFGQHAIPRERFLRLWERLDEFHQQLSSPATDSLPSPMKATHA